MRGWRDPLPAGRGGQLQNGCQPSDSQLFISHPRETHLLFACIGVHAFNRFFALPTDPAEAPAQAPPFRRVDIALGCSYVGEDVRGFQHAFGSSSSKHPATLVLRGISVRDDGNLEDVTEYKVPQENPDSSSPVVFEVSGEWEGWSGIAVAGF